jgi:23S rRNA-/tRNA-specific pseudouridylate synthase
MDKPCDVKHDGADATTVEKLGARWFPGSKITWPYRLDYGTSGLLVGALDKNSAKLLAGAFEGGVEYFAVVAGHICPDEFLIDAPIGKYAEGDIRMVRNPFDAPPPRL